LLLAFKSQQCWDAVHPGNFKIPMVIRGPGVGRQLGAEHSQRLGLLSGGSGLKIVLLTPYNIRFSGMLPSEFVLWAF